MPNSHYPITRTQRIASERVARAKAALLSRLAEELSLAELAAIAGCSPAYLSRTFTRVEGITISRWFRRARIERAGELLVRGDCNVSEASECVGYRSIAHFSRTFSEEKGVPPSRWVEHCRTTLNGSQDWTP